MKTSQRTVVHVANVPQTLHFLRGHIRHQLRAGWRVVVISSPEIDELRNFAQEVGCEFFAIDIARDISPVRDARSLLRLILFLRYLRPDVVHAYTPKAGLLAPIAARITGVHGVVVALFGLSQMTKSGFLKRLLDTTTRISALLADVVWCDSASMKEHVIQERLVRPTKVVVLGEGSVGGIDSSFLFNPENHDGRAARAKIGFASDDFVIGFVGRLNGDKGLLELNGAWRILRLRYPHSRLLLIGPIDGHLPPQVQDELTDGERTTWLGRQANVAPWLSAMDVFVMPSYREGFGVANLEASAMGLPVVSTAIPGCVDSVVDGHMGILVPPRDDAALVQAISRYIEEPRLRLSHGHQGRERVVSDFVPDFYWGALLTLYEEILSSPKQQWKQRRG